MPIQGKFVSAIPTASITNGAVTSDKVDASVMKASAAVTDNALLRFDAAADQPQNSVVLVDDSGNVTGIVALTMTGDLAISGNINATGDIIYSDATNMSTADKDILLAKGYATASDQATGIIAILNGSATTDTVAAGGFTAGVAATSNPTVATTAATAFSQGDLIEIQGSLNPGVYEVHSHAANVLTVRGVGTTASVESFSATQFNAGTSDTGATIRKVTVGHLRMQTSGASYAQGSVTGFSYSTFSAVTVGGTAPENVGTTAAAGSSSDAATVDHVHKTTVLKSETFTPLNPTASGVATKLSNTTLTNVNALSNIPNVQVAGYGGPVTVGDGTKSNGANGIMCYFSDDSGATAKAYSAITTGDELYGDTTATGFGATLDITNPIFVTLATFS